MCPICRERLAVSFLVDFASKAAKPSGAIALLGARESVAVSKINGTEVLKKARTLVWSCECEACGSIIGRTTEALKKSSGRVRCHECRYRERWGENA